MNNINYLAHLASAQTISGSAVLPFADVTSCEGPVDTVSGQAKLFMPGPITINVSLRADVAFEAVLLKNGEPFRQLAIGQSFVNVSVVDGAAAKGDMYAVQIGVPEGEAVVNESPLYSSLSIASQG